MSSVSACGCLDGALHARRSCTSLQRGPSAGVWFLRIPILPLLRIPIFAFSPLLSTLVPCPRTGWRSLLARPTSLAVMIACSRPTAPPSRSAALSAGGFAPPLQYNSFLRRQGSRVRRSGDSTGLGILPFENSNLAISLRLTHLVTELCIRVSHCRGARILPFG